MGFVLHLPLSKKIYIYIYIYIQSTYQISDLCCLDCSIWRWLKQQKIVEVYNSEVHKSHIQAIYNRMVHVWSEDTHLAICDLLGWTNRLHAYSEIPGTWKLLCSCYSALQQTLAIRGTKKQNNKANVQKPFKSPTQSKHRPFRASSGHSSQADMDMDIISKSNDI